MSKTSVIGMVSLVAVGVVLTLGYMNPYAEAEPMKIIIEHQVDEKPLGAATKPAVEEYYKKQKELVTKNLKEKETSADNIEKLNISAAYDSVGCMDRSMEEFPKLIDVINGQQMNADEVSTKMEENCVIDSLVNIKYNEPTRLRSAEKLFRDVGFKVPDINDWF